MPVHRQRLLAPALVMRVPAQQALGGGGFIARTWIETDHLAGADGFGLFERSHVFQCDVLVWLHLGHAVVGHDDDVGMRAPASGFQRVQDAADGGIHVAHGGLRVRCIGAMVVTTAVHLFEVQRGQARARGGCFGQPASHFICTCRRTDLR